MDLEMTGLDPAKHVIVEIATLLTDDELNIIAEGPDLVIHATEDQLAEMDQVVVDMHTRSGLLDQIRSSTTTLEDAGSRTLAFLREHIEAPRSVPLCGNSIGMDRRFLAAYLNDIEEFLHYRSIDVSTIKELARRWYPESLSSAPRKDAGHRALDDITESVNELRYYRQAVFRSPDRDGASEATGTATSRGASEATGTATSRGAGEPTAIEGTAVSGASGAGTSPGTSAESSA
jgi:oligoribonuclease